MSDNEGAASDARRDLFEKVAGRAKEVAGAVVNNDELVDEGRLQQAEVNQRREADIIETAAELQRDEAEAEIAATEAEAEGLRQSVEDRTDEAEAQAQNQRLRAHQESEAEGRRRLDAAVDAAETRRAQQVAAAEAELQAAEKLAAEEIAKARSDHDSALDRADALENAAADMRKRAVDAENDAHQTGESK